MPNRYLGREIGKYKVIRLLGGGAFSWVYEAIDQDLEIPVALKILRPEYAGREQDEARFRREAAIAAKLRHPNIVTVRDVGRVDDTSYVAMDLLTLSLSRRLEHLPRLPETEVIRIGLDIAAALSVAHAGGIVHRDIKPDNILIGQNGEAVVVDFGLASAFTMDGPLGGPEQVNGTPHYFSPEQARGMDLDGRSDLYSLGVTLFAAATGELPFPGEDWATVARAHVEAPVPSARSRVSDLSCEFDEVLTRLLQKRPEDRYASAMQLADALAMLPTAPLSRTPASGSYRTAETVSALPPVTLPSVRAIQTRRQRALIGATTLIAIVLAVVFFADPFGIVNRLAGPRMTLRDSLALLGSDTFTPQLLPIRDSLLTAIDSSADTATSATQRATPPVSMPRPATMPRTTRLTLEAPDSAYLLVDNERLGQGLINVDRTGAATFVVSAIIGDAPTNCATARKDSTVRLAAGEHKRVMLPVRTCYGFRINVEPKDALLRFKPLDGSAPLEIHADSATGSIMLPEGKYSLEVTAPRCVKYSGDTVDATRSSRDNLFRKIPLNCGFK